MNAPSGRPPRVVVVTGARGGIGGAITERFRAGGDRVIAVARPRVAAEGAPVPVGPPGVHWVEADVATAEANRAIVAAAVAVAGRIDVLVCNAGRYSSGALAGVDDEEWSSALRTNLDSAFYLLREADPYLVRGSAVVVVASVAAHRGSAGHSAYAAAKAGQVSLVRSLAAELGPRGVRVNAVSPGVITTPMSAGLVAQSGPAILASIPLGRFGEPDDVAGCVEFLASDRAAYVTGQVVHVNGGAHPG